MAKLCNASRQTRDSRLDLIRTVAYCLVPAVHFLLNTGFYDLPVQGGRMLLGELYRSVCLCCVPLFLVLSGFLQKDKPFSRRYYKGLLRILFTYLLASGACMAVQVWQGQPFSLRWALRALVLFRGAPYSWYVELYLGLFLLIPFLNGMYRGLATQRARLVLVATLLALTALPTLLWAHPMPERWLDLWPVTYYLLGAYLADYPPQFPTWGLALLFGAVAAADGGLWYLLNRGRPHLWQPISSWGGLGVTAATLLLFCLLSRIPVHRASQAFQRGLEWISRRSFSAYLLSWITDQLIYGQLNQWAPQPLSRLVWIPLVVPLAVLAPLPLAACLDWLVHRCLSLTDRLCLSRKSPHISQH